MEASGTESSTAEAPVFTDNPGESRYQMHVHGELAGFVTYHRHGQAISFQHTEVLSAFQGEHLATHLARFVLDDARERGLAVLPFCPYISSWIRKHPDYADLVPTDRRAEFALA
jgi:predicted GNAT family acetyltransferase